MTKTRIMIVEDELIVAKNIENQLNKIGYDIVAIAVTGEDAIVRAAESKPDLILMDIQLSGSMDGVAAAERIYNDSDVPVVFLTAYADEETLQRAKITDPFGYVLKPFEPVKLRTTIEVALYKHRIGQKLKESELRFRTLAASAPVGIFQTDTEGQCIYVNRQWSEITGLSQQEVLGEGWDKALHPDDREPIVKAWYDMTRSGGEFSLEYRFQTPAGKLTWVFGHAAPLTDDFGRKNGYIGTITDITTRKNLENERLTGKKLESIGVLAGGIAHDFNNLLSIITGNISMLKVDDNITPAQQKMLSIMSRSSAQAAELAHKLISFSKGQWLSRKSVAFPELFNNILGQHFPGIDASIDFKMDVAPDLPALNGDPLQLNQVFANLLKNAVEAVENAAAGEEKKITVSVQTMTCPEDNLPLAEGEYIKVSILDSGPGIPEDLQGKIFDPYFTTKEMGSQKGLGLGLTLCYSSLKKHEGHIRVTSPAPEGQTNGTRVDVYLPVFAETAAPAAVTTGSASGSSPDSAGTPAAPDTPGKVLVMDDDSIIQDVISQMLKRLGYQMKIFDEGEKAVAAYRQAMEDGNPFGILLLDLVNKKGLGGMEALRKILAFDPSAKEKAIALSGFSDESEVAELKRDGFKDVLLKPFKWKDLTKILEKNFS
ncbi:MAG: response regulator [bacterium]|nr:response regulator [bacterium]